MVKGNRKCPNLPAASSNLSAGIDRRSASEAAPTLPAKATPLSSALLNGTGGNAPIRLPLSPIAPAKRFLETGDAINADTEIDPADSPAMVTRLGSPPKAAILFCTQRNAAA